VFGKRASKSVTTRQKIGAAIREDKRLKKQTWDHLFMSVGVSDTHAESSGFVFDGFEWEAARVGGVDSPLLGLFTDLRQESATDDRGPWDRCLVRLAKSQKEPDLTFLWGTEADEWRVTPRTLLLVVEKARPR